MTRIYDDNSAANDDFDAAYAALMAEAPMKPHPDLADIEQAEVSLWLKEQLDRMRDFLVEHDADDEMLDAVDYLIEDNARWIDEDIGGDLRAGKLRSGEC